MNPSPAPAAPRAHRRAGWRDPRLAIGLAIMALAVLLGARLFATSDDTIAVWTLTSDVQAGQSLAPRQLQQREVRFADQELADRYLPAGERLPDDAVSTRDLAAGELLPRSALGAESASNLLHVPLSVEAGFAPASLKVGATVDVWVIPGDADAKGATKAERHLEGATVLELGSEAGALSVSGERQVVVGVVDTEEQTVAKLLGALQHGRVVLTRKS